MTNTDKPQVPDLLDNLRVSLHLPARAEVERLKAENAEALDSLRIVTEDRKARTLERDRLVDTLNAARAEVVRLRGERDQFRDSALMYAAMVADLKQTAFETVRKERDYAHKLLRRIRRSFNLNGDLLHAVNAAVALESEGDIAEAERLVAGDE